MRRLMDLTEVALAAPAPFRWLFRDGDWWNGAFEVGDRSFEIVIKRLSGSGPNSYWRVDFARRAGSRHASITETTLIMSTMVAAIRDFLTAANPERLKMSPTNSKREKLYRAILKRLTPELANKYEVEEKWYGTLFGEFELARKDGADA